jgi:hypothetical protein
MTDMSLTLKKNNMLLFKDYVTVSYYGHKHAQTMYIIIPDKEYSNIYLRTDFGRHSMKSNIFHRVEQTFPTCAGVFVLDTKSWEKTLVCPMKSLTQSKQFYFF